ncbi:MAG: adenylyl-sulfate kinase [Alphaproteobacteria bacterium]|jgi:nicotinamide riboside kinase|nr:adenylyl-sulfate kinase [Alphaproteobacteria bacterium]
MLKHKILIMGLPGSGKTTLANIVAKNLQAVHFNADEVRHEINSHLSFSVEDRIEQARRMGWLCDKVVEAGHFVVADFVCPIEETRKAFGCDHAFVVWVDRIREGRFENTNKLFVPPERFDLRVYGTNKAEYWAERVCGAVLSVPSGLNAAPRRPLFSNAPDLGEKSLPTRDI